MKYVFPPAHKSSLDDCAQSCFATTWAFANRNEQKGCESHVGPIFNYLNLELWLEPCAVMIRMAQNRYNRKGGHSMVPDTVEGWTSGAVPYLAPEIGIVKGDRLYLVKGSVFASVDVSASVESFERPLSSFERPLSSVHMTAVTYFRISVTQPVAGSSEEVVSRDYSLKLMSRSPAHLDEKRLEQILREIPSTGIEGVVGVRYYGLGHRAAINYIHIRGIVQALAKEGRVKVLRIGQY